MKSPGVALSILVSRLVEVEGSGQATAGLRVPIMREKNRAGRCYEHDLLKALAREPSWGTV